MLRRLNYTGRRSISRRRVTIHLDHAPDGAYVFGAEYDLAGLRFPAEARVFIEAYNAMSYMRFAFGTIGQRQDPPTTRLVDVTPRPLPKFRLKVVDQRKRRGLLLGVTDHIVALRPEQNESERQPLLPVDFCDLGDRVWRLETSDWPVLELNHRIDGIAEEARSGEDFLGLVYPEIVRQILRTIIIDLDQTDPGFDDSDWTSLWLRYVCSLPGVEPPPDGVTAESRADREGWIEEATQAFCRHREVRTRFAAHVAESAGGGS